MLLNLHEVLRGKDKPASIASLAEFSPAEAHGEFYRRALGRSVDAMTRSQIAKSRPKVQKWIAERRVGLAFLKTHAGRFLENQTPTISPEASAGGVYLVRNPLDVTISYAHHMSLTLDQAIDHLNAHGFVMEKRANFAHDVVGSWTENVESWTARSPESLLVIRYEDAVEQPFKAMGDLARHIGLAPNPLQIGLAVEFSSFKRLKADEVARGFDERPSADGTFFREGRAGQWREVLTATQVDRIVQANGATMERFGYLP